MPANTLLAARRHLRLMLQWNNMYGFCAKPLRMCEVVASSKPHYCHMRLLSDSLANIYNFQSLHEGKITVFIYHVCADSHSQAQ